MNTFQILTSKFRFDLMHWNVSIGPEIWPIFGRFLTLFQLKRPARREKNTFNMAATIDDVMDDVTCKSSIARFLCVSAAPQSYDRAVHAVTRSCMRNARLHAVTRGCMRLQAVTR
jgi:hypothetical protein